MDLTAHIDIDALNNVPEYIGTFLGIEFTKVTSNSLTATMPVTSRTKQPHGALHGGASVVLAETLGSYASNCIIDQERFYAAGLEINANHLRPVSSGLVTGVASPVHLGRKTHVWEIRISNDENKLVCISRHTVAIIAR